MAYYGRGGGCPPAFPFKGLGPRPIEREMSFFALATGGALIYRWLS
jgi:hypothetical protein